MKSKIAMAFLCLLGVLFLSGLASAIPITLQEVQIEGTELQPNQLNRLDIERDNTLDVRAELLSSADLKDVEVSAFISGYEYNDRERLSDATHVFDMEANVTYIKNLKLKLPFRVDEDNYKLRVIVTDRNGDELIQNFNLKIDVPRHSLTVDDVVFSPEGYIKAGRSLLTTVRVSNRGEKDEEGVKVKVSIPELSISASDFIDEVEKEGSGNDDEVTSEELYLRIPDCAKAGTYDIVVDVNYDEGFEKITKKAAIEIIEDEACKKKEPAASQDGGSEGTTPQTIINVGSVAQDVTAGVGGATYPITLTNAGTSSRTYTISVSGLSDWGTSTITPTNTIVLGKGETQSVYVYAAAAASAPQGQRMFSVSISSGDKVLKQIPLTANIVKASAAGSVKRALEIGLVILVVLLVILGLIIGFNKLKGSESGASEESQTYY